MNKEMKKIIDRSPDQDKRLLFFTGKGGVGKTSVSSATAVWLAENGHKTLLVTTDPADHLSQMFDIKVKSEPVTAKGEENLDIARIDQKKALIDYKEKVLSEAKEKYIEDMLQAIKEELNSPCTEEMASFEKFVSFIREDKYEYIVFDTAPTGHTLRLLELPMDWDQQVELMVANAAQDNSNADKEKPYQDVIDTLRNLDISSFFFVLYPENTPIMEAYRASKDLEDAGINPAGVVVNQILLEEYCTTPFFKNRYKLQKKHTNRIDDLFGLPSIGMPLLSEEIQGLEILKETGKKLWDQEYNLLKAE